VTRRIARARSAREPAIHLFEDLQWFDQASDEFTENLVEIAPGNRTLMLLNFRPEYHASWMRRSYYQQLPLQPLGPQAIQELFSDLLGTDSSLGRLAQLIRTISCPNAPRSPQATISEVSEEKRLSDREDETSTHSCSRK